MMAFIVGATLLFLMSGIYHTLDHGPTREIVQRLDHAAIWVLIVGTFTPVMVVLTRGRMRRVVIISAWTVAMSCALLKTLFFTQIPEWIGLAFYIGFAWMGASYFVRMFRRAGLVTVGLMLGGGVSYTLGAVLEFARAPLLIPNVLGPHELFHLTIVLGVVLHWLSLHTLMTRTTPMDVALAAAQPA